MFTCDIFSVCHSLNQSITDEASLIFWLISIKIQIIKFYEIQNICMLNLFTFDEFSVCHSLDQSVTGIALLILSRQYSFSH